MNKIHVVGGPGSGKSYCAKKISELIGIQYFDLDPIFWDYSSGYHSIQKSPEMSFQQLKEILDSDSWIIEGIYHQRVKKSFQNADIIILLNSNTIIRALRLIKRFVLIVLKKEKNDYNIKFKNLIGQLILNYEYKKFILKKTIEVLKPFKGKVKKFKTADKAINYFYNNHPQKLK